MKFIYHPSSVNAEEKVLSLFGLVASLFKKQFHFNAEWPARRKIAFITVKKFVPIKIAFISRFGKFHIVHSCCCLAITRLFVVFVL